MTALDARSARRRYLILVGLRWLPTGLLIPVMVLLALSRGLSLTEIGLVFSLQGLVVLALELPTGGLTDALGRRPILILASLIGVASLGLLYIADSVALFAARRAPGRLPGARQRPARSLVRGRDAGRRPGGQIEHGLSAGSTVLSLAIALGALMSGGLVALDPFDAIPALALPLLVALGLGVVNVRGDHVADDGNTAGPAARAAVASSVQAVPRVIADGIGLLRASRVLLALVGVELFWGFSMVTFESLFPVRLSEVVGDTDQAAAMMGPVTSVAWFASAAGAALIVTVSRRIGVARSAALLRIVQGATIVAMGLIAGPLGVVIAYLACYVAHGASNPMHMTLLHRQVDGPHRATVLSMNSMIAQPAGALGAILLSALADGTSLSTAMVVGGVICALGAPLYIPAWRAERARDAGGALTPASTESIAHEDGTKRGADDAITSRTCVLD